MVKLWLPEDSDFALNNKWLWENYPPDLRYVHKMNGNGAFFSSSIDLAQNIIVKSPSRYNSLILEHDENILRPDVLKQVRKTFFLGKGFLCLCTLSSLPPLYSKMYEIHKRVRNLRISGGKSWEDLCVKVPVVNLNDLFSLGGSSRRKRSEFDDFDFDEDFDFESIVEQEEEAMGEGEGRKSGLDPSVHLYPDAYCAVAESLPLECYQVRYGGKTLQGKKKLHQQHLGLQQPRQQEHK